MNLTHSGENIWDSVKIKLISLHGDHPCLAPQNHFHDSEYVLHTYCVPEFLAYSNKFFKRKNPAIFLNFPFLFPKIKNIQKSGNYFILPKNLDSTKDTFLTWEKSLPKFASNFFIETASLIQQSIYKNTFTDHHELVTSQLNDEIFNQLLHASKFEDELQLFHQIHANLEKIYRNTISELIVDELRDFPLKINGRGWDSFVKMKNKNHTYSDIGTLQSSANQFESIFGIIDVSAHPNALHDRTLRAIAYGTSFMSNSAICFEDQRGNEFDGVFYTGYKNNLREKAELIVSNPEKHNRDCKELGIIIKSKYDILNFYNFLYNQYLLTKN